MLQMQAEMKEAHTPIWGAEGAQSSKRSQQESEARHIAMIVSEQAQAGQMRFSCLSLAADRMRSFVQSSEDQTRSFAQSEADQTRSCGP
jgi:hypothetical protein